MRRQSLQQDRRKTAHADPWLIIDASNIDHYSDAANYSAKVARWYFDDAQQFKEIANLKDNPASLQHYIDIINNAAKYYRKAIFFREQINMFIMVDQQALVRTVNERKIT